MPELPEVETLARCLCRAIARRRLVGVRRSRATLRKPVPIHALRRLLGAAFTRVGRHGKYLVCEVEGGRAIVVHLGMSGKLTWQPSPHTHVRLDLCDGRTLHFVDPRRFGLVGVDGPRGLGPDALEAAPGRLRAALSGRTRAIKETLLDQGIVAGLGNIYACETLHRARIDPLRAAGSLGPRDLGRLVAAMRAVLRDAVAAGGTTLDDESWECLCGRRGGYRPRIYGRPACGCGATVARVRQGGRSTYLCPRCQT